VRPAQPEQQPSLLGWRLRMSDATECREGAFASVCQRPGVLLGGGDPAVAQAFLNDDDVGAAGEEPGGVRGAQVVEGGFAHPAHTGLSLSFNNTDRRTKDGNERFSPIIGDLVPKEGWIAGHGCVEWD
jgi:hypothetical protein